MVLYIYLLVLSTIAVRPTNLEQFRVRNSGLPKWFYKCFTIMYVFHIFDIYILVVYRRETNRVQEKVQKMCAHYNQYES